ncbi:MAG: GGDEF domain-containing protein [Planctomycetes bacterium]|nr:GGDEF domain-containing protein [Planctomycetota bacterium]
MELLTNTLSLPGYVSDTMALAAVALIGYLFGHRTRQQSTDPVDEKLKAELSRAVRIAKELQQVAGRIRKEVALHQSSISQFHSRMGRLQENDAGDALQTLTGEAEALLGPTMRLASNLAAAYDQLRQQSSQLMNFAGSRSDPQTGVGNRRALEEQLDTQLAAYKENNSRFSLTLFSIELPSFARSQELLSLDLLRDVAELLEHSARDTDLVARYSENEFVVLMAQTTLAGAAVFSERLFHKVTTELGCVIDGGIVEVQPGDTPEKLLSRADSALYSARSSGRSCLYLHNGKALRQLESTHSHAVAELPSTAAESVVGVNGVVGANVTAADMDDWDA